MNTSATAPEFTIQRTFNARRELVWRAWTEERQLANWLPPTIPGTISFDVRVGGHLRYTMINHETDQEYPTGGTFLEVVPFERLAFTWGNPDAPDESSAVITIDLQDFGDSTQMMFHLRGFAGRPGDQNIYDGWDQALESLAAHLA